jgi:hypothetical protein
MQARIQGCQKRIKIILDKSALIEALEANAIKIATLISDDI